MSSEDTRNMILAAVLSMAVIIGWQFLFPPPPPPAEQPVAQQQSDGTVQPVSPDQVVQALAPISREGALVKTERIAIETPSLTGSISLKGGRLDDLHLEDYRVELDPGAETVTLSSPTGGPHPYYTTYGWFRTLDGGDTGGLPGPNTEWQVESGNTLSPATPVTLVWDNGEGLTFRRTISVDDKYMFTVSQSVENARTAPVSLRPYGYIARRDLPDETRFWLFHEGAVGHVDDELVIESWDSMLDFERDPREGGNVLARGVEANGWVALTDKYWLTALIGKPGQGFDAVYKTTDATTTPEYRAEMRLPVLTVAPGARAEVETYYFAGAKEYTTLRTYEDELGVAELHDAIDWGWFYFLTKPLARLLIWLNGIIGNMGWSILVLTLIVKAVLFPLAYKSYVSMSMMKKLQPEMEKLKERCGDDKMRMQKEMMELYKKEKVNPAAGCLPILLQIPIFFSLYKVLFVAIELRHAPFIGWIEDLSAPDPTSFMNLFGLLPYEIPGYLALFSIGVYPILMGITMWMQQKLNPAPTDPTQAMIFAWMPWVFMFMLGTFASGLVIYWCANNIITFAQQYIIMRSQGVSVDFFGNIKASFKKKKPAAEGKK
ncbi:MAG: membrane protein insertase YidC [Pseudomonadota bacterium]